MAKVSIIIPSYNHSEFLIERLETIFNQTYKDWEAIIIDDKSKDNSVAIIENFLDNNPSFKVKNFIINTENSGSGYFSWKKGIELSTTDYIWIAETDDFSELNFLEEMIKILDQNETLPLIFCGSNYVEDNKIIYDSSTRTKDLNVEIGKYKIIDGQLFLNKMPFNTYITNGSSAVFRKPRTNIPGAIFNNKQTSDIYLWSFLIQNNKFVFLNQKLNFFRRHQNSTTTKMNIFSKKNIYEEKLKYLNYFDQNHKFQDFLDHYISHFVWSNKLEVFNYKFLKNINGIQYIDKKYFVTLLKFIFIKTKSIWK